MGKECTYGDDRRLTALALMNDFKVVFAKKALAYTKAPTGLRELITQQKRWKKSFIRESFLAFGYVFGLKNKWIAFDNIFDSFMPLFSLIVRISVIYTIVVYPISIFYYIAIIAVMAVVRNAESLIKGRWDSLFYNMIYGYLQMMVMYWLYYSALWELFVKRDVSWGTR